MERLRAVITAADELPRCPDLDTVYRQAVDFARRAVQVERCAIFLAQNGFLQGTYGTDMLGATIDEHGHRLALDDRWLTRIQALQPLGLSWRIVEETYLDWDGSQAKPVGAGWIAYTPIHSAQRLVGIFFNDAAISGAALDSNTQELVSVFCSLLGSVIERKRAEHALAEERNLLRTLIDSVPDSIYVKDQEARFVVANAGLAHQVGLQTPEQLIGKTDRDVFPTVLATHYFADDERVLRTGEPLLHREEQTVDAAGQLKWSLTTKIPRRNQAGEIIGLVGLGKDITLLKEAQEALRTANDALERRIQERLAELQQTNTTLQAEMAERQQAEAALQRERNLLRALIDAVPAYVYIKDAECRFLDANAETVRKLGVKTPDDLIGKNDFDFFNQDLAAKYMADDQAILASGQPLLNIEEPTVDHRTGQHLWLLTTKAPIRDEHGTVIGLVGVGLDITKRKGAEEAQRESERLRLALEKEKELGDLKTQLMLTISHEFRTPLSVAHASAELLEQYYERMSSQQREEHLRRIESQVTVLTDMLEEISLIVHARFERLTLNLEPVNLSNLCAAVISHLQDFDLAPERVIFHADASLPSLLLDARRIQYVLNNLLSNALKYSAPTTQVTLDLVSRVDGVVLRLVDQGIGIPLDEQPRIFEPFYRARNVGAVGGTGLGLSIVKEIVETHQGTISLQSEVNQGTLVEVFLPKLGADA